MRAVLYDRSAREIALGETPEPEAGAGEVLLEPRFGAICASDLHMYGGSAGYGWVASPLVLGHELVGSVAGEGRLVVVNPYVPCGECKACRLGATSTCTGPGGGPDKDEPPWSLQYGFRRPGGFAERLAVRRENLLPVPAGLPPELAALSEGAAVGLRAVKLGFSLLAPAPVETAAVLGPGPVGLAAALALADRGTRVAVLGLPRDAERLARAAKLGATAAVASPEALDAVVDAWTRGGGVDLVVEASGAESAWAPALRAVRRGGVVACVGVPGGPVQLPVREVVRGGVVIAGSYGVTGPDLADVLELLRRALPRSRWLLDRTFPLAEAEAAFAHAAVSSGKVLLEIGRA